MMAYSDSTVTIPLANSDIIKGRIAELLTLLQQNAPGYESLLHTIHRNLAIDPDTVHLLTEEEIGIICSGLQKRTGVAIAKEEVSKMKRKGGKVTLDDL